MTDQKKTTQSNFRLPVSEKKALEKIALFTGQSQTDIVRRGIAREVERITGVWMKNAPKPALAEDEDIRKIVAKKISTIMDEEGVDYE